MQAAPVGIAGPGQQWASDSRARRQRQPRIPHAKAADAILPFIERAAPSEGAFSERVALEHETLAAIVAQGLAWQHINALWARPTVPAHAVNEAHQVVRLAALQVGREQCAAPWLGGHHETLSQQLGAVRGAVARQHGQRHQPLPRLAKPGVEFEQQRRAGVVRIAGQRHRVQRAAHFDCSAGAAGFVARVIKP